MAGCKKLLGWERWGLSMVLSGLLATGLGSYVCMPLSAQTQSVPTFKSRAEMEAALNPELLEQAEGWLRFERTTFDLDTLLDTDAPRVVDFPLTNVSQESLQIAKVTTTCGCTVATVDKTPLAPGERRTLQVTFDPHQSIGTIDTRIFVYLTLSDQHPVGKLMLTGLVQDANPWSHLPHSMGSLKLKRKKVTFDEVKPGQQREVRILCGNSGSTPITLHSELLPPYLKLMCEPTTLAPGAEGDLVLRLDGNALPPLPASGIKLQVLVDGVKGKPLDRMLEVTISGNGEQESGDRKQRSGKKNPANKIFKQ